MPGDVLSTLYASCHFMVTMLLGGRGDHCSHYKEEGNKAERS